MNLRKNALKFSAATIGAVAFGTIAVATHANADEIYTVKSGDTLSEISYQYAKDTSMVNDLAKKNNIADINLIYVGQKLMITTDGTIRQAKKQEVQTTPSASTNSQSTTSSNNSSSNTSSSSSYTSQTSGSDSSAKAWIANRESGGSYTARNGQYIGKYQLSSSYLNGDYSAANQEKVADSYVASQYGSWSAAKQHWLSNGWY
ncbi:aggregation-promoting factor [Paucilactobacillus wasatchensis]|uniref:Aggregation promoting factor n=1 Tax=Paucilactobacillus wasatchensis TaxID=1335616 RepID=A0A0D1A4F9_9LACO|nr:LysM domain-containing protein [Paucilactobacillus wasatchensis]KIS02572.1 Aggregation promoting factor [Paucilactobacillus wasatchensis]